MKKLVLTVGVVAMVALLATTAFAGNRGAQFIPLGHTQFHGGTGLYSAAFDITSDGNTVAGLYTPFGGCQTWTAEGGWVDRGITSSVCYMGDDGTLASRIIDSESVEHSAVNYSGLTWDQLQGQPGNARCDFLMNGTFGISGDGSTIGGLTWEGCGYARGYSWTDATGMEVLVGDFDDSSRVNGLNHDGSVAVGWNRIPWGGWHATVWTNGVGEQVIDFEENFLGEAYAVSGDGSDVAGFNYFAPVGLAGEGWVQQDGGDIQSTGGFPWGWFFDQGYNFDITDDGSMTVGAFGFGPFRVATFWTEATGLVDVNQFLIDQGSTAIFDGWVLGQVNAVSADGTKMVGNGRDPNNLTQAYLLDISKVSVCHAPPGYPENARTNNVSWGSLEDHLGHGDFLGTCEAARSARSRDANWNVLDELRRGTLRNRLRQNGQYEYPGGNVLIPTTDMDFWKKLDQRQDRTNVRTVTEGEVKETTTRQRRMAPKRQVR